MCCITTSGVRGRMRPDRAGDATQALGDDRGRGGRRERPVGRRAPPRPRAGARGGLLAARRGAVRPRPRDDLRGVSPSLRPAATLRRRRPGHERAPRRLPLCPRPRPDLGARLRDCRGRPGRAPLAVRRPARRSGHGRRRPRRRSSGRDGRAPRQGRPGARRRPARRCASTATGGGSPGSRPAKPGPRRSSTRSRSIAAESRRIPRR